MEPACADRVMLPSPADQRLEVRDLEGVDDRLLGGLEPEPGLEQRRVEDGGPRLRRQVDPAELGGRALSGLRAGLREIVRRHEARAHLATEHEIRARDHRKPSDGADARSTTLRISRTLPRGGPAAEVIIAAIASCERHRHAALRDLAQEVLGEFGDIFFAFAEGGDDDFEDVKSEV